MFSGLILPVFAGILASVVFFCKIKFEYITPVSSFELIIILQNTQKNGFKIKGVFRLISYMDRFFPLALTLERKEKLFSSSKEKMRVSILHGRGSKDC